MDVFQPHVHFTDEEILEFLESPDLSVEPLKPITPNEIREEITLKYEKTPGMDLITPKMIMKLTQKDMILLLFNPTFMHQKNDTGLTEHFESWPIISLMSRKT